MDEHERAPIPGDVLKQLDALNAELAEDQCVHRQPRLRFMWWRTSTPELWRIPCRECEDEDREAWVESVRSRLQIALYNAARGYEHEWLGRPDELWELEERLRIMRIIREWPERRAEMEERLDALRAARKQLWG
jgi:hypothetical protein